jgi:hypothetical protein
VFLVGIFLCASVSVTTDMGTEELFTHHDSAASDQVSLSIVFITPFEGEILSGNFTVKINATVVHNIPLLLRWNNDSWIDLTNWYNGTSHFYEYPMDVTCLPTGNVTFEAKQDTGHGILYSFVEATVDWYRPPVLVVCDYYDANITEYYTSALETLGYYERIGYSTWYTSSNGSPTVSDLLKYQFVIWFRGGDTSTIPLEERNAIEAYLTDSSGRKMLLTGTETAWRAYNDGGYEVWLSANFGVNDYIRDGSNTENLLGCVGTPFFGANYTYGGGDGSHMTGWADWVRTLEYSIGIFEYASSGYDEYAATMSPFVNGIFFGFAFDAISTSADRLDLMNKTLNYLLIYDPPQTSILTPLEGELRSSAFLLNWESVSVISYTLYNPSYKIFVDGQLVADDWILETYLLTLSDGNHTIRIVCEDNYGQRGYDSVTIEIDASNPRNEITNFIEGAVLKGGSLLIFNITDSHLDNVVSGWDSDTWTIFSPPYQTYLPSGDGVHILHVNSTDVVGNWNYTQFSLTCDDTPPDISLINHVNGSNMMSGRKIQLTIEDMHLNIVTYHWDQDDDSFFETEYETFLPPGDGLHDLFVNATDIAGNQRLTNYQFFADNTAPTILLLNISNHAVLQTGTQLSFQVVDLYIASVGWRWDSADTFYYDVPAFVLYAPAVEGMHLLFINATDEAGNNHLEIYEFVIDNTAPEIAVSSPTEGSPIIGGTSISVNISDAHLTSVQLHWDLENWIEWTAPYITTAPMDDGYHALFVNASDNAGNWIQVVFVFQIDNGLNSKTTTTSTTVRTSMDLATSFSILGIGVGMGVFVTLLIQQFLTRRKLKDTT